MRSWIATLASIALFFSAASGQDLSDRTIRLRSVAPQNPTSQRLEPYGLTREDMRLVKGLVPSIQTLIPIRNIPNVLVRVGDRWVKSLITGTTDKYDRGKNLEVIRGRFLSESDLASRNNVAVIHADHAQDLFANQNPIGEAIQFKKQYFTVVGVIETELPPTILIPYTTMRSRLGDQVILRQAGAFEMQHYELSEVEVVLITQVDVIEATQTIQRILKKNHSKQDFKIEVNR